MKLVAQVTGPSVVLARMAEMIVAELERTEADGVEGNVQFEPEGQTASKEERFILRQDIAVCGR